MRPEEEIARAHEARKIADSPLIKGFFVDMDRLLLEQLVASPIEAVSLREKIHGLLCMRQKFEELFQAYVDRGSLAESDIAARADWRARQNRG